MTTYHRREEPHEIRWQVGDAIFDRMLGGRQSLPEHLSTEDLRAAYVAAGAATASPAGRVRGRNRVATHGTEWKRSGTRVCPTLTPPIV